MLALDGASFRDIKNGLEADGIMTGGKKTTWHISTIQGIKIFDDHFTVSFKAGIDLDIQR